MQIVLSHNIYHKRTKVSARAQKIVSHVLNSNHQTIDYQVESNVSTALSLLDSFRIDLNFSSDIHRSNTRSKL